MEDAKKIVKIVNETSNDYDAIDQVIEFLQKIKKDEEKRKKKMYKKHINLPFEL